MSDPLDLAAEAEKLRSKWHAAEAEHEKAIEQRRSPAEVEALREKMERLKAAYIEKAKAVIALNDNKT
jgi:hypothetical protein